MEFLDLDSLLRGALEEDLGWGDVTTDAICRAFHARGVEKTPSCGEVIAKQDLVLAGWPVFFRVFELLGPVAGTPLFGEGDLVERGACLGKLEADARVLLRGERVALNLLQRLCGIATLTRQYVDRLAGTRTRVLDTRKTTPLWRSLEKYAVRKGGGFNHRMGLDDAVLIKDNHIAIAGGVRQAIEACRREACHLHKIEVEVVSLDQLETAIDAGADVVLLDNMEPEEVGRAVRMASGRCLLEASGGVTLETAGEFAGTGVDYVSVGALTHSYSSADISLEISPETGG